METHQTVKLMESDVDPETAKCNRQCENQETRIGEENSQMSRELSHTTASTLDSESGRQSTLVDVMSGADKSNYIEINGSSEQRKNENQKVIISEETGHFDVSNDPNEYSCSFDEKMPDDTEIAGGLTPNGLCKESNGTTESFADDDFSDTEKALRKRKKSLERLCDVLMDERDKATSSLKAKGDDILRLRKFALECEKEKMSAKSQLAKALTRTVQAEKETAITEEENAKLTAEIVKMTKRMQELEAENGQLKRQLEKARDSHASFVEENKATVNVDSVTLSRVDELEENADSGENPIVFENGGDCQRGEAKPAEMESVDENVGERAKQERAAMRTSPNFYRHSLAGSLPRPFHSIELPRQNSQENRQEQGDSLQPEATSEIGVNSSPGLPPFMKKPELSPIRKSGFSPVQFNYHPLPESILQRRESWDAMRHASWMRPRVDRSHSFSSDSGFGENDSGTRTFANQQVENVSREEHTNELTSARDSSCLDQKNDKREEEIEDKMSCSLQASSLHSENTEDPKDLVSDPTAFARETHANDSGIPLGGNDHNISNDQSQEPGEERIEKVSDLVNIWNNRTIAVTEI